MGCSVSIVVNDNSGFSSTDRNKLQGPSDNPKGNMNHVINYLEKVISGICPATVYVDVASAQPAFASGTATLSSAVATNTCVINGVTFTCVASGATGNQFNVGGTDTITATNLAAAINASTTALVQGYVSASSVAGVVTITSMIPGLAGNAFTLACTGGITASGARLTGGAGVNSATGKTTYSYGN